MRVWVTRDEDTDGPLCTALRQADLEVVLEPVLERRVVDDCAEAVGRLAADDWLVLTSPFAIDAVAAEPARIPRVAVVAEPSRRAAELRGFRVELSGPDGTGKGLFDALRRRVSSGKVCYPRSALVTPPSCWAEVELTSPVLYETVPRAFSHDVTQGVDVVSVASPSAVNAIGPAELPFASIGPSTSTALRQLGIEPWVEAPQPSFESLARIIADHGGVFRGDQT